MTFARCTFIHHTMDELSVDVSIWPDKALFDQGDPPVESKPYGLPWAQTVSMDEIYTALRTFPELADAELL